MGTRGLVVVQYMDEYRVANYNRFDSYPDGVGRAVLGFAQELQDGSMNNFKRSLRNVRVESPDYGQGVYNSWNKAMLMLPNMLPPAEEQFLSLNNNLGAAILYAVLNMQVSFVINNIEFANNSIVCEWVYVLDLDSATFEVFRGGHTKRPQKGDRFYAPKALTISGYKVWPVELAASWPLDSLPSVSEIISRSLAHVSGR